MNGATNPLAEDRAKLWHLDRVSIALAQTDRGFYPRARVCFGDIHLHADIVSDRQIRQFALMARDFGADFMVAPELRERVDAALAGHPELEAGAMNAPQHPHRAL